MSTNPLDRSIKRRTLLKAGLTLGALQFASPFAVAATAAEKKYGPGATDKPDQDRQHHALQRTGVGLRGDRQDRDGVISEDQRRGRNQRPQDRLHFL